METQGFVSRSSDLPKCRCLPPSLLRDTLSSRVCRQGSTALELDGARNTKIQTGSGRELRNTLRPVWLFVLSQMLMSLEGVLARPYISGGIGLHGKSQPSTVRVLLQHYRVVSFVLQLVIRLFWQFTREVRYIHELSLTLEHSMPISSPAASGLTGTSLHPHQ